MPKRYHKFPAKMRAAREAAGMTQAQLAKKCGWHFTAVSQYETGKHEPTLSNAIKIAKALKIELEKLI